jgi:hypothetical protein
MSLKEEILRLEGKVPLGQKNEATEAIEENPYDSRGIQEEYVGHKQDPELVGLLKEGNSPKLRGSIWGGRRRSRKRRRGFKAQFWKGNVWHACWRAENEKRVSEATEAY